MGQRPNHSLPSSLSTGDNPIQTASIVIRRAQMKHMNSKSLVHLLSRPQQIWEILRLTGELPKNHPEEFLSKPKSPGKVVACLGDSITHGNVSYDWVSSLRERFQNRDTQFINAGINGNVVWQLNQRVPRILSCQPDVAIVLIGTNDVMGSFHHGDGRSYQRQGKLPALPTRADYQRELRTLLRSLQRVKHVAVCTLPPLGENPHSPINRLVVSFNENISEIVAEEHRVLLPLGKKLFDILHQQSALPHQDYRPGPVHRLIPIVRALTDYYVHEESWDQSASNRGLELLPDHIHLGEKAGGILADLVSDFLEKT